MEKAFSRPIEIKTRKRKKVRYDGSCYPTEGGLSIIPSLRMPNAYKYAVYGDEQDSAQPLVEDHAKEGVQDQPVARSFKRQILTIDDEGYIVPTQEEQDVADTENQEEHQKYPENAVATEENKADKQELENDNAIENKEGYQVQRSEPREVINNRGNYRDERYRCEDNREIEEYTVKLCINNLCGNNNEVEFPPAEISVREGTLEDLNEESVRKIIDTITCLPEDKLKDISKIVIPVYIFNINNVLTSGNKNTVDIE